MTRSRSSRHCRLTTSPLGRSRRASSNSRPRSHSRRVAQTALLQAGTAAQQFARTVGFGPEQTQGIVALGVALARLQGTDPSQSINLLTQALQGNAQAAQSLNLQLDASFIAFSQLGGASAEVFNQLDPATQAAVRYAAALDQIGRQSDQAVSPQQELAKATGELGTGWEAFVGTVGPGVVGALAKIVEGANAAIAAIQHLNAVTVERNRQSGSSDEDFKNERAALDALGQAVQDRFGPVAQAVTDKVQEVGGAVGGAVQQANDALRETTGVDVLQSVADAAQTAGDAVGEWAGRVGDGFDQLGQSAAQAADAITGSFRDADTALQQTQQSAEDARRAQLAALASVAAPTGALRAAQQNEITAARELVRLKQESVDIGAQEAAIRLQMLPAQERMLELQLQTNRAQIEATQRALPAQRGLQDLQNALEEQRLIAQSGFRPMEERQAALRTGAGLVQQLPEAQLAALRAQGGATPTQRAAQDVQLQQQLLALDQQQATASLEFQRQQISLLGQIADAAKQAAQRTIEIAIQAINVAVQTAGGITEDDEKRITELAGSEVVNAIHQALQTVNQRSAPQQLLGAGG